MMVSVFLLPIVVVSVFLLPIVVVSVPVGAIVVTHIGPFDRGRENVRRFRREQDRRFRGRSPVGARCRFVNDL